MKQDDLSIQLLQAFTQAHGASGHEDEVRSLIRTFLPGFRFTHDRLGGITAWPAAERQGPLVAVSAHMDEIGFLVQNITPDGFIQIVPLGGWWSHTLPSQRMRIKTRNHGELLGIVASVPPHFLGEDARNKVLPLDKLFIDIGARDRRQATEEFGVNLGDPIVPEAAFQRMRNPDLLTAKAFDNRVGVALMVQTLLTLEPAALPCRVCGMATVQEELGTRGARAAGAAVNPDVVLVLEGPPADDTPGLPSAESQGRLGGGVQIRVMDPSALMNRPLVDLCVDTAKAEGISSQLTIRKSGGTDAAAFQFAGIGCPVVVLGVPARYIHTHNSIISLGDYHAALRLLAAVLRRMDQAAVCKLMNFQ